MTINQTICPCHNLQKSVCVLNTIETLQKLIAGTNDDNMSTLHNLLKPIQIYIAMIPTEKTQDIYVGKHD